MSFLSGLFEDDKKNNKELDVEQDLTPQIQNTPAPLTPLPTTPVMTGTGSMFNTSPVIVLTNEDKKKWEDFCMDIYNKARAQNPIYNNFVIKYEAFANLPLTEAQKVSTVAQQLKGEGITKEQIIAAVSGVQNAINDAKTAFDSNHASKVKAGIEDVKADMNNKRSQIAKLEEEIKTLDQQLLQNNQALSVRVAGFQTYFSQVCNKVISDAQNITNYIQ